MVQVELGIKERLDREELHLEVIQIAVVQVVRRVLLLVKLVELREPLKLLLVQEVLLLLIQQEMLEHNLVEEAEVVNVMEEPIVRVVQVGRRSTLSPL